jgi:hypothetical protein
MPVPPDPVGRSGELNGNDAASASVSIVRRMFTLSKARGRLAAIQP